MEMQCAGEAKVFLHRLGAFGEAVRIRDARGQGPRPALVRGPGGDSLQVRGSFSVIQRFSISPAEGRMFVDSSRDSNPIHREGSVVSGAMTAARLLLLPEVLVPAIAVRDIRLKFRAFSHYGRVTVNRFHFRPAADGGFAVDLAVRQDGVLVADGVLHAAPAPQGLASPHALSGSPAAAACSTREGEVRDFFRSLRLDPGLGFEYLGLAYPRAFLAALPSGEMVRRGGDGLLNVLDLEFPEAGIPDLAREASPTVEVEPSRPRNLFRRVLARVANGLVTSCQGYATVLLGVLKGDTLLPAPPEPEPAG